MPLKFVMSGALRASENVGVGSSLYEVYKAATGQNNFTLAGSYTPGVHELEVYRNGVRMRVMEDYEEVDNKTVSFLYALDSIDVISFFVREIRNTRLHQEFVSLASQTVFNLSNPYHPTLDTLQVYDEGKLLRRGVDYLEENEYTVRLLYTPVTGAKITFKEIV